MYLQIDGSTYYHSNLWAYKCYDGRGYPIGQGKDNIYDTQTENIK